MSKSINSNAMDSLLQGLTGKTEEQEAVPTQECPSEAPSPTRRKEKPRYEVISTMVDPDVMSKVRTIADIEEWPSRKSSELASICLSASMRSFMERCV